MASLNETERDLIVRTILAEAGNEPDKGKAAVAHAILNRMKAGAFGEGVHGVLFKPNAFEPWGLSMSDKNHPHAINPNTKAYKQTSALLDDVIGGHVADPTGGATHFLNEDVVKKRRGGTLPPWAKGEGQRIGNHTFHKPDSDTLAMSAKEKFDASSAFSQWEGGAVGKELTKSEGDKFDPAKAFGQWEATPTKPVESEAKSARYDPLDVNARSKAENEAQKKVMGENYPEFAKKAQEKETAQARTDEFSPGKAVAEHFTSSKELMKSGAEDVSKSLQAKEASASGFAKSVGGASKTALGAAGALLSPLTGLIGETGKEIGKVTGNREFGEKLPLVVPSFTTAKTAISLAPGTQALRKLVEIIPENRVSETIQRLESNPSLTPMDVNKTYRSLGKGIAVDPASPKAQQIMQDFVEMRSATTKQSVRDAAETLGKMPQPLAVLENIQQKAVDVGKKIIEPIVASSKPADVTPIIKFIDKEVGSAYGRTPSAYQSRLEQLRDEIRGSWADRNPMLAEVKGENGLHKIQSDLRAEADNLLNSAVGSERTLGHKLMQVRDKLVGSVDAASGGKYRESLGKYRSAKEVEDSFNRGMSFEKNRKGEAGILEDSTESWQRWIKGATEEEKSAARLGALVSIKDKLEATRTAKGVADIPLINRSEDKLSILFGEKKANEFFRQMRDERRKMMTLREVEGGSDTAERLLGAKGSPVRIPGQSPGKESAAKTLIPMVAGAVADLALPAITGGFGGLAGLIASGGYTAGKIGKAGFEHARYKGDLARRSAEAEHLTSSGAGRDALLALLREKEAKISGGKKGSNLLSSPLMQALPR